MAKHEKTKRSSLPNVAVLLPLLPWLLSAALLVASPGGNWAFLVLALIVFVTANCMFGAGGMVLAILTLRRRRGVKRGIIALALSCADLFFGCVFILRFLI